MRPDRRHPERSEGPLYRPREQNAGILRFAQNDGDPAINMRNAVANGGWSGFGLIYE
jgi:hypothetical protein